MESDRLKHDIAKLKRERNALIDELKTNFTAVHTKYRELQSENKTLKNRVLELEQTIADLKKTTT